MTDCQQIEPLLAARAFGALDADERRLVDRHLASCAVCQRELAEVARLPGLLDLAGDQTVRIESPPALLETSVLATLPAPSGQARRRSARHKPRRRLAASALTLAVAAGVAVFVLTGTGRSRVPGSAVTLAATIQNPRAHATVRLHAKPWGIAIDLQAKGLQPTRERQIYEMWFVSSTGRTSAGTFTVPASGNVYVTLAVAGGRYQTLGITREPDAANPAGRGPNVLWAPLPS